jgi:hypothetical protein
MDDHLERLRIAQEIPDSFGKMKARVYANAFSVLQAVLDLVRLQLVYLKTPVKLVG